MMMLLVLTSVLGYELKTAVGTSVFIMTFTAFTGAVSHVAIGGGLEISMSEENKKMRQHRMSRAEREQTITRLTREMKEAARLLQFEHAAFLRDEIEKLQRGEDPTADTSTRRAAEKQRKTGKGRRSYKK